MSGSDAVIAPASGPVVAPDHLSVAITVVIPALNEVGGVGPTIDRVRGVLATTPYSFEIVVVDDGSTDGTGDAASRHGAKVIRLKKNRGYGAALKAGILNSQSEYVIITDADGTYPPEAIPALLTEIDQADMVVGARSRRDPSIPRIRRPAKLFLALLASYLAGQWIPDLNSGLRIIRRSLLLEFLHVLPSGFSFTTTITLALMCTGHNISYEPIVCAKRVGSSKLRAKEFTAFIMLVLRTVVLFNPLKVFLPLGSLLFLIGVVKLVTDVILWNLSETAVMAFLSAIIVWSVGLLADMISRLQLYRHGSA